MPLTDEQWEALSSAYNEWVDDVGDVLEGLAEAAQVAERSVEATTLAGVVVGDLGRRIRAAAGEIIERTNELTMRVGRLAR